MEEIIYFELDNWFYGRDYPNAEPFTSWMSDDLHVRFMEDDWCKQNHLCVRANIIDMSVCFRVAATRTWVEENCPKLLTDEQYSYDLIYNENTKKTYYKKYSDFICHPDNEGHVYGWLSGIEFPEYTEDNFGIIWENEEEDMEEEE